MTHPVLDRSGRAAVVLGASAATLGAALIARERRARRRAERLAAALSDTLLNAIDATDPETGGHVRRVARYARILAEAAGAPVAVRHQIERVALFHDIGRITDALFDTAPDGDRLSAHDRRAIATHPTRGALVLAPLAAFYPELPAGVLAHHERWDGTGYPHRVVGTAIPFPARVVAIADAFDGITHRRPDSHARSLREAVAAMRAGRATQFDPRLVDFLLSAAVLDRVAQAMRATHTAELPGGDQWRPAHAAVTVRGAGRGKQAHPDPSPAAAPARPTRDRSRRRSPR